MQPTILPISRPSTLGLRDFPHVFPPPNAIPFSRVGFVPNIAPAGVYNFNAGQQILIPVQQIGFLSQIAVQLSSYGGGQVWTLTLAGVGQRDYINVPTSLGAPETPVIRHLRLPPQQALALSFKNGGAGPLSVSWSLYGWYFDPKGRR